jgi:uncharacterized protein YdeI (YjbR/CyaY-like superfamily)
MSQNTPKFFKSYMEFRKWLEKNHLKKSEIIVGFYKVGTNKCNMTWSESVDQALCFGWIDSVRRSIDEESYCIRFTPRKPSSIWSNVNINKMEELMRKKLVFPAGISIYKKRKDHKSGIYAFEKKDVDFSVELVKEFKKNKAAWNWFQKQVPSYKKVVKHWVMSGKKDETRMKRLKELILDSEQGKKIKQVDYSKKK